jgi:hypothetical protein
VFLTSRFYKEQPVGIREKINDNPAITSGVVAVVIILAIILIVWNSMGGGPGGSGKAFFTIDDGKTWFADDAAKIPPFMHDGKEAVRVFVFTCDEGKTKWAGYLQKYTPEAKKLLEVPPDQSLPPTGNVDEVLMKGTLFKKVGAPENQWVSQTQPHILERVQRLECPGGGDLKNLRPVDP